MVKKNNLLEQVLKTIGLAMGVTIVVLVILGQFNTCSNILTGIGLFALAMASLQKET